MLKVGQILYGKPVPVIDGENFSLDDVIEAKVVKITKNHILLDYDDTELLNYVFNDKNLVESGLCLYHWYFNKQDILDEKAELDRLEKKKEEKIKANLVEIKKEIERLENGEGMITLEETEEILWKLR